MSARQSAQDRRSGPWKLTWRCHTCGTVSTSYAAAERHADGHGGARIEVVFPPR